MHTISTTGDITTELNTAISGGENVIYFPPAVGKYIYSGSLIPTADLHLFSDHMDMCTLEFSNPDLTGLRVRGDVRVAVDGMTLRHDIDFTVDTYATTRRPVIGNIEGDATLKSLSLGLKSPVKLENCASQGLKLLNCEEFLHGKLYIRDAGTVGVYLADVKGNGELLDIKNTGDDAVQFAIGCDNYVLTKLVSRDAGQLDFQANVGGFGARITCRNFRLYNPEIYNASLGFFGITNYYPDVDSDVPANILIQNPVCSRITMQGTTNTKVGAIVLSNAGSVKIEGGVFDMLVDFSDSATYQHHVGVRIYSNEDGQGNANPKSDALFIDGSTFRNVWRKGYIESTNAGAGINTLIERNTVWENHKYGWYMNGNLSIGVFEQSNTTSINSLEAAFIQPYYGATQREMSIGTYICIDNKLYNPATSKKCLITGGTQGTPPNEYFPLAIGKAKFRRNELGGCIGYDSTDGITLLDDDNIDLY